MRDQLFGGRYRLVRRLGEGGMGQVWEAQDATLGRNVAVKVVSLLAGDGSRGGEARARFLREARITARLQHPNIVTIHDLGETGAGDERVPFLVMELVRGEGLDTLLRRRAVTLPEAARWGAQVCDALAEAHAARIMHRDIKPSNILVTPSDIVKVLDFGIAQAVDPYATADRLTQDGFIVGTPPYMAPEQARGFPQPRSDLYALGCLLFELITGRLPFQAPDTLGYLTAHLTQEPPAPSSVSTDVPAAWDDLVLRLLEKDPDQRYPSATALSQALRHLDRAPERPAPPARRTIQPPARTATTPLPPVFSKSVTREEVIPATLEAGPVRIDVDRHVVTVSGSQVDLSLKEYALLEVLLRNAGRVLTRMQLIDHVWGTDYVGDARTLDVHVKRLRAKIETHPGAPRYLVTVRGLGYKFDDQAPGPPPPAGGDAQPPFMTAATSLPPVAPTRRASSLTPRPDTASTHTPARRGRVTRFVLPVCLWLLLVASLAGPVALGILIELAVTLVFTAVLRPRSTPLTRGTGYAAVAALTVQLVVAGIHWEELHLADWPYLVMPVLTIAAYCCRDIKTRRAAGSRST